jgi:hypothetical protein
MAMARSHVSVPPTFCREERQHSQYQPEMDNLSTLILKPSLKSPFPWIYNQNFSPWTGMAAETVHVRQEFDEVRRRLRLLAPNPVLPFPIATLAMDGVRQTPPR